MQIEKLRPSPAGAKGRGRRPPVQAKPGEADGRVAELRALGPEAGEFALTLVVVNRFRMWAECPHQACRRARACRGDDMVCLEERSEELKRKILEEVVLLLCAARVSSDEFYDYLDEITEDAEQDSDEA
jgi:hypothetical protein